MDYTKGRWEAKYDHALGNRYVMTGELAICELIAGKDDKANAHLISAAPELYEALKNLLDDAHYNSNTKSWSLGPFNEHPDGRLMMARNAIAKAMPGKVRV